MAADAMRFQIAHTLSSDEIHALAVAAPQLPMPSLLVPADAGIPPLSPDALIRAKKKLTDEIRLLEITGPEGRPPYRPPDITVYPYKCVGKLECQTPRGTEKGTAFLVGPGVILTAAHIVMPPAVTTVATNIQFMPYYPEHGSWYAVDRVYVHPQWATTNHVSCDVAVAHLARPVPFQGHLGIALNQPKVPGWTLIGYPGPPVSNSEVQMLDMGLWSNAPWASGRPGLLRWNTNAASHIEMGHGASGGPWFTSYNPTANVIRPALSGDPSRRAYFVDGVSSTVYTTGSEYGMLSPMFSMETLAAFFQAALSG